MNRHLLEIKGLKTVFETVDGTVTAVDGVSFSMTRGETLGVVGESGSGKSVTALSVMRLLQPPGRIVAGSVHFDGCDLARLSEADMRDVRGNRMSMIFQEPMTSLNPLATIGDQVAEMFVRHCRMDWRQARQRAIAMLDRVRIPSPARRSGEYPHQLSGGLRQRVMIAMALACDPEMLIADEPTTALDVTIQAQVLDLMRQLKEKSGASIMMITHDLGVVAEMAQRVVVMYAGQVMETGDVHGIFEAPAHPYTRALLDAMPRLGDRSTRGRQRLREIRGAVPSLFDLPAGCRFAPRCPDAMATCRASAVPMTPLDTAGRWVRCRLWHQD